MVSFYFKKKRDIANGKFFPLELDFGFNRIILGLVTAGTGIGALSFGPLANFLMGKWGWKTGMLIFAGIMLTCILFGAIMRPLKAKKVFVKREIEMQ
jgi:MFS family permease